MFVVHTVNLLVFSLVYRSMDFEKHFTINGPVSTTAPPYYAVTVSSSTGFGDITPKTNLAKTVTTIHTILSWGPPSW